MCPARYADRLDHSASETAARGPAQPSAQPLVVGAADDHAEREADRVAGEVITRLQGGAADAHQHSAGCGHGDVRRAADTATGAEVGLAGGELSAGLSARIESRRGRGSALPGGVRQRLEQGFGGSLSDVRIHADGEAASLNRAVSARAFTTGKDIFFGAGEFRPDTPDGEHVLAHELAHTRQRGSGAQRTAIRRWDLKAKKLGLNRAADISTLSSRPIWFVKDEDGDRIVVKTEDQPLGLGEMAAKLQKRVAGIGSVSQRKLEWIDRLAIDNLLEVRAGTDGLDESWRVRGDALKSAGQGSQSDDAKDVAKADAQTALWNRQRSVIAMSVAEGESAEKAAQPGQGLPDDDSRSTYRKLLMDPKHLRKLGEMTAVDLFFGNQDRLQNGNLGNWFVNPQGRINLIDSIDPGNGDRHSAHGQFATQGTWENAGDGKNSTVALFGSTNRADDLADLIIDGIMNAGWDRASDTGGDSSARAWARGAHASGAGTRKDFIGAHMAEGFDAGIRRIIKIFSSTKWSLTRLRDHSAKKSIRGAARKAAAADGGANDYYAELKRRAQWLKAHAI